MNIQYQINRSVILEETEKGGYVGIGSRQAFIENKEEWNNIVDILYLFLSKNSINEIRNNLSITDLQFYNIINFLLKNNFIVPYSKDDQKCYGRYDRNFIHYESYGANPIQVQENLLKSKVTIIGCGGIGNHISAILSGVGVGEITLIDDDIVELSNLTRQILFSESDVGEKKTKVVKREIQKRNSGIIINEINLKIKTENDLFLIPRSDLWILSADEPILIGAWIHKYCYTNKQAYIRGCYLNDISIYGPMFIPEISKNYDLDKYPKNLYSSEKLSKINSAFKVATYPTVNAIAAASCAGDVLKY